MMQYTPPNLLVFNSNEEKENIQDSKFQLSQNFEKNILFEQLSTLEDKFVFVYGDPGLGKTRLLQEVAFEKDRLEKKVFFIDLKKIKAPKIEDFIKDNVREVKQMDKLNKENLQEIHLFKSNNFLFENNENTIIFLDALDEVPTGMTDDTIGKIEGFINANSEVQVWLSCRRIQFKEKKHKLSFIPKVEIQITKFSDSQVREILKENLPKLSIEELLFIQNKISENILQIP